MPTYTTRLIILFTTAAAAAAVLLRSQADAAQYYSNGNNEMSTYTNQKVHRARPPPRPRGAPDVEYENHPFDQYRHLYDNGDTNHKRGRRTLFYNSKSLHRIDGLRSPTTEHEDSTSIFQTLEDGVVSGNNSSETKTAESSTPTTTLDPTTDQLYKPLRIQFDVRHLIKEMELARSAGNTNVMTKLQLLIYEVLPMTAQVWGDTLRVIPVSGGIYPLAARGSSAEAWLPNAQSNEQDASTGNATTIASVLYDDPVRAFYCPDETTSGISGGADLLIFATVNRHCDVESYYPTNKRKRRTQAQEAGGEGGTLASALSCQRDQYDRPITGSIDFCLSGMSGTSSVEDVDEAIAQKEEQGFGPTPNDNGENVIVGGNGAQVKWDGWFRNSMDVESPLGSNEDVVQYSAGVAIHEIGHVLGVSSDSLSYFRHPITGYPLTPRPFSISTVTCVTGEERAFVGKPSATVMREGIDKGSGKTFYEVITPTVRRIVQNHFNCSTATGARLENQPTGDDCFGSHFDERLFFTDIMGAVFSPSVNVLSPLVLAYLEDSGWYRANYESEYVHIGTFGHGAGCAFLEENCIDSNGNVPEAMEGNFCNNIISASGGSLDFSSSGAQKCDPSHTQKAYCDWVDTNSLIGIGNTGQNMEPAPFFFQYVDDNPNLRPYTFTTADYCPIAHLNQYSCFVDGHLANEEQLIVGEYYGSDSRCVETDGSRSYSLCLHTNCNKDLGQVEIMAGGQTRTCEYDGQIHAVGDEADPVRIKCPKAALICPELFCPANCAGRGECVYRSGDDDTTSQPLAKCICDSEDDTTEGCFRTPMQISSSYGPAFVNPNRANKAVFLAIVGSLVIGLAIFYIILRQWKARQNVFM